MDSNKDSKIEKLTEELRELVGENVGLNTEGRMAINKDWVILKYYTPNGNLSLFGGKLSGFDLTEINNVPTFRFGFSEYFRENIDSIHEHTKLDELYVEQIPVSRYRSTEKSSFEEVKHFYDKMNYETSHYQRRKNLDREVYHKTRIGFKPSDSKK